MVDFVLKRILVTEGEVAAATRALAAFCFFSLALTWGPPLQKTQKQEEKNMEEKGIDPFTSRMRSERSTI